MEFVETSIPNVMRVVSEPHHDERGHFVRTFCDEAFGRAGLELPTAQMAVSYNAKKGTLRGLHFIPAADGECKLVRCIRGAVFDVAVDLRPESPTFRHWTSIELSARNMDALYIPRGIAHGFVTLSDDADILYQFSQPHRPGLEQGVAWDDPDIAVDWPLSPVVMSDRDKSLPLVSQIASLV